MSYTEEQLNSPLKPILSIKDDYIMIDWVGVANSINIIKTGGEEILDYMKKNNTTGKVLNSNLHVKGSFFTAENWIQTVWFPDMIGAGLKHFAWVMSPNSMAKKSSEKAAGEAESELIQLFSTEKDAEAWLKKF